MATNIGTIQLLATIDTGQYKKGASEITSANKDIQDSADNAATQSSNAFVKVAKVGLAAVAGAAIAVGAVIVHNFDDAIKRVDTLNNSARSFGNMGFSADQIDASMKALVKSVQGLPTSLDAAVRNVQLLASSTNDLGKSQKLFKALNDGILGFGGNADMVDTAVIQLSQAFAGGRVMAQDWNSMLNAGLGPTLNAIAKQMGITTAALKDGLSDGSISVGKFQDALINLDENGGGGLSSLSKIVKDSTSGIGTGIANMNTAIVRGIADVIKAIGPENISNAITAIGEVFENSLKKAADGIKDLIGWIKDLSAIIQQSNFDNEAIDKFNFALQYLRSSIVTTINTIKSLYATLSNSTPIIILEYFISQVFIPAIKAINAAITQNVLPALGQLYDSFVRLFNALNPALIDTVKVLAATLGVALLVAIYLVVTAANILWQVIAIGISVIANIIGWIANLISWFGNLAAAIIDNFSGIAGFFASAFKSAFYAITGIFGALPSWFANLWAIITGLFSAVGVSIGNAIGNAFKAVINGVLKQAIGIINGFISAINGAIGAINKVPGVNISKIGEIGIPQLAKGGIVTSPTLAMIGEGGQSEAVIPLDKLDSMINGGNNGNPDVVINIDMKGIMARSRSDLRDIGKDIVTAINEELRAKGAQVIGGGQI